MIKKITSLVAFLVMSTLGTAAADPLVQVDPKEVDLTKDVGPSSYYGSISQPPEIQPKAGQEGVELTLTSLEGNRISLRDYLGKKPLVIVSASASCPIYRGIMKRVEGLKAEYGNQIEVLVVYTLEAHPALDPSPYTEKAQGQWTMAVNVQDRVLVRQPTSYDQRVANAIAMAERYHLDKSHIVVDEMDNRFWTQYGKFPNSLFILDTRGFVAFSEAWATKSMDSDTKKPKFEKVLRALLQVPSL